MTVSYRKHVDVNTVWRGRKAASFDVPAASSGCDLIFHHVNGSACNDLHSWMTVLLDGNSQLSFDNNKLLSEKKLNWWSRRHPGTSKMSGLAQHEWTNKQTNRWINEVILLSWFGHWWLYSILHYSLIPENQHCCCCWSLLLFPETKQDRFPLLGVSLHRTEHTIGLLNCSIKLSFLECFK